MAMIERYAMVRDSKGWTVFYDGPGPGGRVKIGTVCGRALSLAIPVLHYCKLHGINADDVDALSKLRDREIRGRGPSAWRVFELTVV